MKEHVWDYLPEVSPQLEEHLKEAEKHWGKSWQKAPSAGMVERIKHHIEDELLAYSETGHVDNLLAVMGYGLILYIREIIEGK